MRKSTVRSRQSQVAESHGSVTIAELSAQVQKALGLLDSETADGIIGEHNDEYDALVQGANAVMAMEWAVMKTHGLRQTRTSLKAGAQALTMVLTLVHYAYALGVRRGRAEGAGEPKAKAKPRSRPPVKPTG